MELASLTPHSLLRRRNLEGDLDRELESHFQLETEEHVDSGLSPEEASPAAVGRLYLARCCRCLDVGWLCLLLFLGLAYMVRAWDRLMQAAR